MKHCSQGYGSTIFQLYRDVSFIAGGNRSPRESTDLLQVTDTLQPSKFHLVEW
jgi:hypothetical protein